MISRGNIPKTSTTVYKGLVVAPDQRFEHLRDGTDWIDGIFSKRKNKISRKAFYHEDLDDPVNRMIAKMITNAIKDIHAFHEATGTRDPIEGLTSLGTYVNYYRDGNDFCPAHSHPGQIQLVISLGATRPLKVGAKIYNLESGDVIVFGSSTHSIEADSTIKDGRISIATFMTR